MPRPNAQHFHGGNIYELEAPSRPVDRKAAGALPYIVAGAHGTLIYIGFCMPVLYYDLLCLGTLAVLSDVGHGTSKT